jgi:flagellar basal body-associated protein FliL
MPEKKQSQTQNSKGSAWWVPLVIGVMVLMVPGGMFVSPVFFIISAIMKARNKPKEKSPEPPHSPLPLINTQP